MSGSFKLLYLQTRRKSIATLSPSLTFQPLLVDESSNSRTGGNKGSFSEQPNPGRAKRRRSNDIIHICNTPGGECGARH